MAKATASPPAKRHSGDRLRGKAKTPKQKTKKTSPPRIKSARKHENKPGPQGPFLLNRLVHFHAAIWHNLSPPLTTSVSSSTSRQHPARGSISLSGSSPRSRANASDEASS